MKKNLQIEFIKYFYGITTELDEYVKQELYNFGNNMYMLFSFSMIGGWILSISSIIFESSSFDFIVGEGSLF